MKNDLKENIKIEKEQLIRDQHQSKFNDDQSVAAGKLVLQKLKTKRKQAESDTYRARTLSDALPSDGVQEQTSALVPDHMVQLMSAFDSKFNQMQAHFDKMTGSIMSKIEAQD